MKKRASPKPDVTIFADASFCPKSGAAGWGAWMVGNGKPSSSSGGALQGKLKQADDAEMMALANALHVAVERGYVREASVVMLQSDCSNALARIRGLVGTATDSPMKDRADGIPAGRINSTDRFKGERSEQYRAVALIGDIASRMSLRLVTRHVRGHRAGEGRNWVNQSCDQIARSAMRLRREELLTPTINPQSGVSA